MKKAILAIDESYAQARTLQGLIHHLNCELGEKTWPASLQWFMENQKWENEDLGQYLDALGRWVEDAGSGDPDWNYIAALLLDSYLDISPAKG